jgi:hypothetical protein
LRARARQRIHSKRRRPKHNRDKTNNSSQKEVSYGKRENGCIGNGRHVGIFCGKYSIEKIPVFVANKGVGHGGTFSQPHGSDWAMASVAWLQWQFRGDAEAGKLFTGNPPGLARKEGWTVDKKNIP